MRAANTPPAAAKATVSVRSDDAASAPSITSQPVNQTVGLGRTATFVVTAIGAAPLAYQWTSNGRVIAGANSASYTTSAVAAGDDGSQFSVVVSNSAGSATSNSVTLTVSDVLPPGKPGTSSLQNEPKRTSRLLNNFYVGVQAGYIGYAFSNAQLQPGFQAQSVQVPHLTTRFVLFGHEFGKYLSGQVSEIVPAHPVTYENVNGVGNYPLWMNNIAAFTVKARLPLSGRWSLFGEGGLGVVTRNGFTINGQTGLNATNYATFLYGGGLDYRVTPNWDVLTGVIVAPGQSVGNHPTTAFFSGGFDYTMRNVPAEPGGGTESSIGPIWPRNVFQVGYITDAAGFGANNFFSQTLSIFWHGSINVASGLSVSYHRNLFHTRRFFAIDWGTDLSSWKSEIRGDRFVTASLYPAMRFPLVRTNPVELYVSYSLAGPSLITRTDIDGQDTGRSFTWQDYMSFGYYLGRKRRVTGEIRIAHYSNANLFPQNPGITIPLGFYFGSTF